MALAVAGSLRGAAGCCAVNHKNEADPRSGFGLKDLLDSTFGLSVLSGIADREDLPRMAIGFAPINGATAIFAIDLHICRAEWGTAVPNSSRLDPTEDSLELSWGHAKREMARRKWLRCFRKVEG